MPLLVYKPKWLWAGIEGRTWGPKSSTDMGSWGREGVLLLNMILATVTVTRSATLNFDALMYGSSMMAKRKIKQ